MPTPEQVALAMNDIAGLVHNFAPDNWGFCILFFSYGDDKQVLYASDTNRSDVAKAIHQLADRLEKGEIGFKGSKVGN